MEKKETRGWKVAALGELMVYRPFSMHSEEDFLKIKEMMEEADVGYGHLEMNFLDQDNLPCVSCGDWVGSYMNTDPVVAKDIRWMGVDIMSLANNHSFDFGAPGIIENRRHCIEAGIASAGTGKSLDEAGAPAYFESPAGRVALISTTSGNRSMEWANLPKGNIPARPGVNPLRVHTRYHVTPDVAEALRKMGNEFKILYTKKNFMEGIGMEENDFSIAEKTKKTKYSGNIYVEDDKFAIEMYCDNKDLERILRIVRSTRKNSDFLMIAHHFNISDGPRGNHPPAFVREFAHAVIDEGADVFFGHGWHKTLGIEIYKGKPIFYGVGNCFAQAQFLQQVPYDGYEIWDHDMDKLPTLMPTDEPLHPGMDKPEPTAWTGAVYEMTFDEDNNVTSIVLTPLELGREYSETEVINNRRCGSMSDGRPLIAHGTIAGKVLERFQDLSRPFGTEFVIENEKAIWKC